MDASHIRQLFFFPERPAQNKHCLELRLKIRSGIRRGETCTYGAGGNMNKKSAQIAYSLGLSVAITPTQTRSPRVDSMAVNAATRHRESPYSD